MRPDLDDPRRPALADEAQGGLPLAQAIGTRNLIIIIVTMPLVFIFVVLALISRNPAWIRINMPASLGKPFYPGS